MEAKVMLSLVILGLPILLAMVVLIGALRRIFSRGRHDLSRPSMGPGIDEGPGVAPARAGEAVGGPVARVPVTFVSD